MAKREVIYEPHPVSPERKAELVKAGYKIRDAAYAPAAEAAKAAMEAPSAVSAVDIGKMRRAELVEMLEAHGVVGATGKVSDLRNWLKKVMFV